MAKGRKTGGRVAGTPNKSTAEIRDIAQQHGPAAIAEAARLMLCAESEAARLTAIGIILERGYGKAVQPQHHSGAVGTYDLTGLPDEKLQELERILGALAVSPGDPGRDSEA
jgi:phage terminase small subunit